jgi:cytochrome b
MGERILVWDVPVRVFHWTLVLSFCGAFLTAESDRFRDVHVMLGYTVLGMVAFRVLWGFVGGRYARFSAFLFKPGDVIAYLAALLRGNAERHVGHNPAGSVAIWLLLALATIAGFTGWLALQDGGEALEELHEGISFAMLTVVALHVAGVAASSLLHGENLVRSMFTGVKEGEAQQAEHRSYAWVGVIMLLAVVTFWACYSAYSAMSPDAAMVHAEDDDDDD